MGKVPFATRIERRLLWPFRFWQKVKIVLDHDSCWEWQGALYTCGYGKFRMPGPQRTDRAAHILSWLLIFGEIPDGRLVLHRCPVENKKCVRPSHLYIGNKSDNALDYYHGTARPRFTALGPKAEQKTKENTDATGDSVSQAGTAGTSQN
jgi:hypothetical protein